MSVLPESQDQDGEQGAQLCCPVCGSFFLCSDKTGGGAVFHVFDIDLRSITILREADGDGASIDRQVIACGACSWQGPIDDLVDSSMS